MNHINQQLIEHFYSSFDKANAEAMVNCYADNVTFEDPAFGVLHGNDAKNMWRMLVKRSKGKLKVTYSNLYADEKTGKALWIATYPFGKSGRKVVNKISASFEFNDGKITRHTDEFDLWKWARQALGIPGLLLGWSPLLKNKIRKNALAQLQAFNNR